MLARSWSSRRKLADPDFPACWKYICAKAAVQADEIERGQREERDF